MLASPIKSPTYPKCGKCFFKVYPEDEFEEVRAEEYDVNWSEIDGWMCECIKHKNCSVVPNLPKYVVNDRTYEIEETEDLMPNRYVYCNLCNYIYQNS